MKKMFVTCNMFATLSLSLLLCWTSKSCAVSEQLNALSSSIPQEVPYKGHLQHGRYYFALPTTQ